MVPALITYMCDFVDALGVYVCTVPCMCACGGSTGAPVPLRAHLFCTLCPVN